MKMKEHSSLCHSKNIYYTFLYHQRPSYIKTCGVIRIIVFVYIYHNDECNYDLGDGLVINESLERSLFNTICEYLCIFMYIINIYIHV